jgi:hypothetical protein
VSTSLILPHALAYAARGWAVLPLYPIVDRSCGCGTPQCPAPGKHPYASLVPNGLHNATTDADIITRWWTKAPSAHVAIRTGTASGLLVLDLDDRPEDGRDGRSTWLRLLADHAGTQPPDTVEASTGGGGRHLFFALPDGLTIASSKDQLGPGVEVKAEGGYVVAAPSGHLSGRAYEWDAAGHPDDQPPAPIPAWLLPLLTVRQPRTDRSAPRLPVTLAPLEVAELRSALAALPSDDRDEWVQIGMALHQTGDLDAGFRLWDEWSQTSHKYKAKDALRVWRSFTDRDDGLTVATVYARALRAGWQRPDVTTLATLAGVTLPTIALDLAPRPAVAVARVPDAPLPNPWLDPLPGALEDIVQWGLATAPRPVRLYAVSAALALGSVLSARRYVTSQNNYTSLYFLTVGRSGTGKEHVRTMIEELLGAVSPTLIGPNAWTSGSAVFSGLLSAPQQLAVIDEMGQWLEASSGNGESARMKDTVNTELMQLFSRLHSTVRMPQYATASLSAKQAEALARKVVERPGLTLVGLTTPGMWFGALKSARVVSGYMNRFLVINAEHVPRGDHQMPHGSRLPDHLAGWAKSLLLPRGDLDLIGRLTELPPAHRIAVTADAQAAYLAFGRDCNAWADQLDREGLGELPMRAAEQAMRLGLIAALADDPTTARVEVRHADWAIRCLQYSLSEFVAQVHSRMADTPLHAMRKAFLALIRAAGDRGLTQAEIARCSALQGVSRRDRDDAVAWVQETHDAAMVLLTHGPAGGRPRRALVATEFLPVSSDHEVA